MANVLVLRTLGLHPMTRALHNICVTYLLTETHSGYDMPWDENQKSLYCTSRTFVAHGNTVHIGYNDSGEDCQKCHCNRLPVSL